MAILSSIVLAFTLIQWIVALVNLLSRPSLPAVPPEPSRTSILIPARNEANTLPLLLHDLLHLPVPPLEIIICDDHSTDRTYAQVTEIIRHHPQIRLFRSQPLPPGWLGKNFACYQLAQQARGEYLLFLDADVRIEGNSIPSATAFARQHQLGLLSVFPRQIMLTPGEKATVPLMTYILLTLLPLPLVYRVPDQSALAAANGQFMLFEAVAYRNLQPHREVRTRAAEDIAISRLYKQRRQRIACLTGISAVSCRMYSSRQTAIAGFARNLSAFFADSLALAFLFWLLTSLGWLPILLRNSWYALIAYLAVRLSIRIFVSLACCQSVKDNLWGAIPQQVNMFCIIIRALKNRISGAQEWKGRNILKQK